MLMTLLDAMHVRKSVRAYADRPLAPDAMAAVEALLAGVAPGPFGAAPRFALVERDRARREEKVRLGTYGFIQGAPYFIAGAVERRANAEVDYGHALEGVVLELTRMGLGTCWLGGTFKRDEYAKLLRLEKNQWVPAVLAVGWPADKRGVVERLVRWGAKADGRLPWSALFFDGDFSRPLTREAAGPWADALDLLRLGPSASNKQPWRVVRDDGGLHLFLQRTPGYARAVPSTDLQRIDMGIAMRHLAAAAAELGLPGQWRVDAPPPALETTAEYVADWTPA